MSLIPSSYTFLVGKDGCTLHGSVCVNSRNWRQTTLYPLATRCEESFHQSVLVPATSRKAGERWRPVLSTPLLQSTGDPRCLPGSAQGTRQPCNAIKLRTNTCSRTAGTARCSMRRARLTRHGAPRAAWQGSHTRQAATCSCWPQARSCLRCAARTAGRPAGCCLPRCALRCITVECN